MKRISLIITLLTVFVTEMFAQVSFTVQPPRNVIEGNRFSVTYRLQNADGSGLKAPHIDGCTYLYGPSTSTMQSYQMINGEASSTYSTDYTFIYRADKAGTYKIPSASINADGKTIHSQEATFKVLPADQPQNRGTNQSSNNTQSADNSYEVNSDDVFIRIILSKSKAYEQEAIECTIKLYTKHQISEFMPTSQPTFEGFLIEEIPVQPALNEMEHYNGQNYMTAVLQKSILFPQKSGKLKINSGKYNITVVQYERVRMGFFYEDRPVEKRIQVNSNSASINVLDFPQPEPEGFTGAVGRYTIDSKLSNTSLRTNEAASLTYTIKGTGNIKYLKEPVIDFPSEFELYTPKTEISANVSGSNVSGTTTIEYTFVPQSVGDFKIGAGKFVYFNPATEEYVTLSTPAYDIKVAKGVSATTTVDKKDVKAKVTDILHIKTGINNLSNNHEIIVYSWSYWIIYISLSAILTLLIIIGAKRNKLNADVAGRKQSRANKVARRRLNEAVRYMKARQNDKFYDETLKAIWGYLSDKLAIPASQLTRENIANELMAYGAPETLIQKFIDILDQCEMARYAPVQNDEQVDNIYQLASSAMSELAGIKRAKTPSQR